MSTVGSFVAFIVGNVVLGGPCVCRDCGAALPAAAAILMWGTGDAAGSLIGIPFGKHKARLKGTDGKKSWEGSIAMVAVSFLSGFFVLLFGHGMSIPQAVLTAGIGALFAAGTELFSPSRYDTVTVPTVTAAVLLLLAQFIIKVF